MPATDLTVTDISRAGTTPNLAAANADGHLLPNSGREFLMIANSDSNPHTVTAAISKQVDGVTPAGKQITVPAGGTKLFGPFKEDEYSNTAGKVAISFDAVTGMTVQALRLVRAN